MKPQPSLSLSGASTSEFTAHMHLVLSIVADFMRRVPRSVQREDLVAAGSVGLLQALRSVSHTSPEMLVAYARLRIRGAIIDELRRQDWAPRRRRTPATNAAAQTKVVMPASESTDAERPQVVVIGFDDLPPTQALPEQGPSPLESFEAERTSIKVHEAVEKLPPRERSIVKMRYFEDLPSKTIASTMGVSEARISQLLARATSQLKVLLEAHQDDVGLAA